MSTVNPLKEATPGPDRGALCFTMCAFIGIPPDDWLNGIGSVPEAFEKADIYGFSQHLLGMDPDDLNHLTDKAGNYLSISTVNRIKSVIAYWHYKSRQAGKAVDPMYLDRMTDYNEFRTSIWIPQDKIIPWASKAAANRDLELEGWQKSARPVRGDYPTLKDDNSYHKWKLNFSTTVKSHSLEHLLDPNRKILNRDLDTKQCQWLFKNFMDKYDNVLRNGLNRR